LQFLEVTLKTRTSKSCYFQDLEMPIIKWRIIYKFTRFFREIIFLDFCSSAVQGAEGGHRNEAFRRSEEAGTNVEPGT
jgi:hypothetical protein